MMRLPAPKADRRRRAAGRGSTPRAANASLRRGCRSIAIRDPALGGTGGPRPSRHRSRHPAVLPEPGPGPARASSFRSITPCISGLEARLLDRRPRRHGDAGALRLGRDHPPQDLRRLLHLRAAEAAPPVARPAQRRRRAGPAFHIVIRLSGLIIFFTITSRSGMCRTATTAWPSSAGGVRDYSRKSRPAEPGAGVARSHGRRGAKLVGGGREGTTSSAMASGRCPSSS